MLILLLAANLWYHVNSVKQGRTEEKDASSDVGEPKQPHDKDLWDNEGCKLWDLSVIEPQAELMVLISILDSWYHVIVDNCALNLSSTMRYSA